jgi:hypothetical protein
MSTGGIAKSPLSLCAFSTSSHTKQTDLSANRYLSGKYLVENKHCGKKRKLEEVVLPRSSLCPRGGASREMAVAIKSMKLE